MADPLSVQLLAFNFASRTMAYQRLARALNRALTVFSAFVRNYLELCFSAIFCTLFMDNIGCGVASPKQILPYLRKVFQGLRRSGLILSPEKCVFGSKQVSLLGNVNAKEGLKCEKEKIEKVLRTLEIPKSVKQVETYWLPLILQEFLSEPNRTPDTILQTPQKTCFISTYGRNTKCVRNPQRKTTNDSNPNSSTGKTRSTVCNLLWGKLSFKWICAIDWTVCKKRQKRVCQIIRSGLIQLKSFWHSKPKMSIYCKKFLGWW